LKVLDSIKDRLWLPHRAADEFFRRRLKVIGAQERTYDDTIKQISQLEDNLENSRQHPFVSDASMSETTKLFKKLKGELSKGKKRHSKRIKDDEIQNAVAGLFEGRVGEPYDTERLAGVYKEGESRYAQKIPPGFKDDQKDNGKYGDLLIWFQIIEYAKEKEKGIVFITDDNKEDWWEKYYEKRTVGPHPKLVEEFREKTKQSFYMYQSDRFMKFAEEYLKQKVDDKTVDEIKAVMKHSRRKDGRTLFTDGDGKSFFCKFDSEKELLIQKKALLEREMQVLAKNDEELIRSSDIEEAEKNSLLKGNSEWRQSMWAKIQTIERQILEIDARRPTTDDAHEEVMFVNQNGDYGWIKR